MTLQALECGWLKAMGLVSGQSAHGAVALRSCSDAAAAWCQPSN